MGKAPKPSTISSIDGEQVLWLQWVRYIKRCVCTIWELEQIMMRMGNICILRVIIFSLFGVVYEGRVIEN